MGNKVVEPFQTQFTASKERDLPLMILRAPLDKPRTSTRQSVSLLKRPCRFTVSPWPKRTESRLALTGSKT